MPTHLLLKLVVSTVAIATLVARLVWPALTIDAVSLGLITIALLPWLASVFKSVELPGGLKVTMQDIKQVEEGIFRGHQPRPPQERAQSEQGVPFTHVYHELDPNLALLKLRVDLERYVREAAQKLGLNPNRPLLDLVTDLKRRSVLSSPAAAGITNLIHAANIAAHGAEVDLEVGMWANWNGPHVLDVVAEELSAFRPGV